MRPIYSLLLYLLTPFVLLRLLWRSRELPEYRRRIGERFGFVPRPAQDVAVWVHAVSVGETLAALPLIHALIERHGKRRVLVTTTTPTGSARVREALGDRVLHVYAPYDLPDVVARFVRRMRPQRAVIMETELWPNLFRELRRRGVPLVVANARLSPRSFAGYGRVRAFTAATLADCTHIAAQSEADAQRFRALGAPDERVSVMGNIKLDQTVPQDQLERGQALRERLGGPRPAWIAASTHEGEEEIVLAAHRELLRAQPGALLILVPRHPQRFDAVARMIERAGLGYVRRSAQDMPPASGLPPVLL
ncbi:MAG: 3-deoxy-D-manno-octulosonic acid transferase, partial [Gammaproteobacteria bacterium]